MTVSSTANRDIYTGNGSLTVFAYTFRILDEDEILVQIKDTNDTITTQTITTHYTVSGVGDATGGNITFVTAPAATDSIILTRNVSFLQSTDYTENAALPAETLEQDFDSSVMRDQQLKEKLDRSLFIDADLAETFSTELPEPTANYILAVNTTKTGFSFVTTTSGAVIDSGAVTGDLTITSGDLIMFDGFSINDDSDNEVIEIAKTASAVNHIKVTNAATGNGATIEAAGGDTNVDLNINAKGSGVVKFGDNIEVTSQKIVTTSNGDIDIEPHGTGNILLGNFTLDADQTVNSGTDGYVLKYNHSSGLMSLASGGVQWTAVTSGTASSSANLSFTDLTTFTEYLFQFEALDPATDGVDLYMTFSVDNGSTYETTGYTWMLAGSSTLETENGSECHLTASAQGSGTSEELSGYLILNRGAVSNWRQSYTGATWYESTASTDISQTVDGFHTTSSDIDAVKFAYASGNINAGTIRVFGR